MSYFFGVIRQEYLVAIHAMIVRRDIYADLRQRQGDDKKEIAADSGACRPLIPI